MRRSLSGLWGATFALALVLVWAGVDYVEHLGFPGTGRHAVLVGVMAVVNGLAGYWFGAVYQRARELSVTDQLTRLHNRSFFVPESEKQLGLAQRYGYAVSVALIDLDDFKNINDTQGHLAGDAMLREVAACFQRNVRHSDTAARFGGDEFVLLLPHTTGVEARLLLERVAQDVAARNLTVSAGVATFPEDGATLDALLAHADDELYRTKARHHRHATAARPAPHATSTLDLNLQR